MLPVKVFLKCICKFFLTSTDQLPCSEWLRPVMSDQWDIMENIKLLCIRLHEESDGDQTIMCKNEIIWRHLSTSGMKYDNINCHCHMIIIIIFPRLLHKSFHSIFNLGKDHMYHTSCTHYTATFTRTEQ